MQFDLAIIDKYEKIKSPFYTTYPTGGEWNPTFTHTQYLEGLKECTTLGKKVPMALYVHFPFCKKMCLFCFCYTRITTDNSQYRKVMGYIFKELNLLKKAFDDLGIIPELKEIHLGGGSPTLIPREDFDHMIELFKGFRTDGNLKKLDEFALEIDPRTIIPEDLDYFYSKDVSRISMGIQDINPEVQKAVNRVQPIEMVENILKRKKKGCSVNFDLIYGLPHQTRETFRQTMEKVKELSPDRLSIYNYDHTPDIHRHQTLIKAEDLAPLHEKMLMYTDAITDLLANGYEWVGVDHFAKTTDKLANASRKRTLGRNLNGYTTDRDYHFELGIGPSSIGSFGRYYVHNLKDFKEYYAALDAGKLPVFRGYRLTDDDIMRREIILNIICNAEVDMVAMGKKYNLEFHAHFKEELDSMKEFIKDGLVVITPTHVRVTQGGKLFVQHVAKVFDALLRKRTHYVRTHAAIRDQHKNNSMSVHASAQ